MKRSLHRRVLSGAPLACAAASLVWIAMVMASTAQASPGDTELVSIVPNASGSDISSLGPRHRYISGDGRFVVFRSNWCEMVDGWCVWYTRLFVRDREAGTTEPIDVTPSGLRSNGDSYFAAVSANGRYVAFTSAASDLVAGGTAGQMLLRDLQTRSTVPLGHCHWTICEPDINADGRYVAFTGLDNAENRQVFVLDRQTGLTEQISLAASGTPNGWSPSISADGRYVAFVSVNRVFVRDRQAGTTEQVCVSTSGEPDDQPCDGPAISADGRYVAFMSGSDLDNSGLGGDIFIRDRVARTIERLVQSPTGPQRSGGGSPSISADGRYVVFETSIAVFVRDRELRRTVRASVNTSGIRANGPSIGASLSADGRVVAFSSIATNLATNDTDGGYYDVFVHELGVPLPSAFSFAIKPTALAFGNQALFTNSTLGVWVTNKGTTPLPISSVGVIGFNPVMFSVNNRCGTSLAVGASCSIRVTFRPTSVGDKSAKLRVGAGDNDVRTKALSGTGVVSAFSVSPTSLDFGSVPINTTTAPRFVTISNTGSAVLPISSITLAGWNPYQFTQTHNCPANLAVEVRCTISVVFKPTDPVGSKAALLNITPGGGAAMRSVALAGAARR